MQINLDTQCITPEEAHGLVAFLSSLFPQSGQAAAGPGSAAPSRALALVSSPKNEEEAIFGVPTTEAEPTPQPTDPTPSEPTTHTRRRRTKAEIAADKGSADADEATASQATSTDPTQGSAVQTAVASVTTQSAPVTTVTASAPADKPLSADELRGLLNGYIAKHSMEEAIARLQEFECNRVTEALALDPVKLSQLAEALRG